MSATPTSELRAFHTFLGEKLNNGGADVSPEEALDEWRQMHPEPFDEEDDVAAIQAALDDVARGDKGMPLAEFDRRMRKKFNIPPHKNQ
jgi:hypothetical protein